MRPRKFSLIALALAAALALTACGGSQPAPAATEPPTDTAAQPADTVDTEPAPAPVSTLPTTDRSGAAVTIPENIETIVTLAPSLSQTVVDLGLGDKIIGYDLNSVGLDGLPADVPTFDTVNPDVEALVALAPDVLLVSSLSLYDQEAPYQPLIDAGVCVLCVPTAESIADVKDDIIFLAAALGARERGAGILQQMSSDLAAIADAAAIIPDEERRSVYFEISAAPYLYSTGSGTYLHELIELIGADNILADTDGWCSVEAESVVAADPDVILTNVNYIDDPTGEIMARDGWSGLTAVASGEVYYIDNMASSLPNENIVTAARQMAAAVYPDYFEQALAA